MDENYLNIRPSIRLVTYRTSQDNLHVLTVSPAYIDKYPTTKNLRLELNDTAYEICKLINGTMTLEEIIDSLSEIYSATKEVISGNVNEFFQSLEETNILALDRIRKLQVSAIEEIFYNNSYPFIVSLELTNKCNLRCLHCYGSYGEADLEFIPKETLDILGQMFADIGVFTVELTGGDPSVYPYTAQAISAFLEHGISRLALLTNGANVSEDVFNTLVHYKDRVFVQIDLHSLQENYFDWFTGTRGNLSRILNSIDRLVNAGVNVTATSVITPGNLNEIEDLAEYAYSHNMTSYGPTIVINIGRALCAESEKLLLSTSDQVQEYEKKMQLISMKYPGFLREPLKKESSTNCGTVTSHCAIRSNGDIKLCTIDTGDYFNFDIGNIHNETLKSIFDRNRNLCQDLRTVTCPSRKNSNCTGCPEVLYCEGCMLRGFLKAQELGNMCHWGKQQSCTIKDAFLAPKEDGQQ
jgi:MoaA/NifB/PqqE/SkfB family radical SAM enzyme